MPVYRIQQVTILSDERHYITPVAFIPEITARCIRDAVRQAWGPEMDDGWVYCPQYPQLPLDRENSKAYRFNGDNERIYYLVTKIRE